MKTRYLNCADSAIMRAIMNSSQLSHQAENITLVCRVELGLRCKYRKWFHPRNHDNCYKLNSGSNGIQETNTRIITWYIRIHRRSRNDVFDAWLQRHGQQSIKHRER